MLNSFKKILPIVLAAVMLFSGVSAMGFSPASSAVHANSTYQFVKQVPVYIENNLSSATPAFFDEKITVNSSLYYPYENANLSNVAFTYLNDTVVPSWLQSGNSNTATNTTYWLRLNYSIPAHSTLTLYMSFVSTNSFILNTVNIGEAPGLSSTYGQFDDGSHVFPFYDNFAGTSLNTALWTAGGSGSVTVDNGISFTSNSYVTSNGTFPSPSYADAYGIMNSPSTNSSTSYFLGGVGFGAGGLDGVSPVVTSGWTEGYVNGLGMSMWNSTGLQYSYNISRAISPDSHHVFGTGFISPTFLTTTINSTIENQTTANFGSGPYNIVLGFQANDFPTVNHFSWIRDTPALPNGMELPYTLSGYNVTFRENGLPAGSTWTLSVSGVSGTTIDGTYYVNNYTVPLPNGTYGYSVASTNTSYHASPGSGTFTVSGSAVTVNFNFVPTTYNATFIARGLPSSSFWSVTINGKMYSATGNTLNASLMNGTYDVSIYNTVNGYQAYPFGFQFIISGTNLTFPIIFESPANQTYARAISTIQPGEQIISNDYYYPSLFNFLSVSAAIDQKDGLMFNTMLLSGNVTVTDLNTNTFLSNISFGPYSGFPLYPYYDQNSGYLYITLGNGSIAMVNPGTLSAVKYMDAHYLAQAYSSIVPSGNPNILHALGFAYNSVNYNIPVVYSFYTNGTMIGNTTFPLVNGSANEFFGTPVRPYIYGNDILTFNLSNIVVLNMSTGKESLIPVPSGYVLGSLVPYGSSGSYILGDLVNNTTLMFSPSNMTIYGGPFISGFATSGFYDSLNRLEYIQTFPNGGSVGNLTVMNPVNNRIMAQVPELIPSLYMVFDQSNQNLYSVDYYKASDAVHVYSTQKAFPVNFSEYYLPSGNVWYVNITGGPSSGPIQAGSYYIMHLPAGTYTFTVGTNDKLYSAKGGTFTVSSNGNAVSVGPVFRPVDYNITVTETGLPSGTLWYLNFTNGQGGESTGSVARDAFQNGTYSYSISSSDARFASNITSGSFTIAGNAVSFSVAFHQVAYYVTFRESGLKSGTSWYVIVNGVNHTGTGTTIKVILANGTYTYSVGNESGYLTINETGTFKVNGSPTTVNVAYGAPSHGFPLTDTLLIAGVIIAVAAIGSAVFFMRRKGPKN